MMRALVADRLLFCQRAQAQGLTEYGLLLSFATLVVVGALVSFGGGLGGELAATLSRAAGYIRVSP